MDAYDTGLTGIYHKPSRSTPIDWLGPDVAVISLGCAQSALLNDSAQTALAQADIVFGSDHHFQAIANVSANAERVRFPSPFKDLAGALRTRMSQKIVVLASGDSLFYGVGAWLIRLIGRNHLQFYPNVSSVQACFHAIRLPWQSAQVVSLHGRPLAHLRRHLKHRQTLALFTDARAHPQAIAQELVAQGFADSDVWVCEALGSERESITHVSAHALAEQQQPFDPLNVCIVKLCGRAAHLPAFPGIDDEHFVTGSKRGFGMISKREVRLAILSLMQPTPGETAWDIGAGCGSVSVEWARFNAQGSIYAIESDATRVDYIKANAQRFGAVLNTRIIHGVAPDACEALPDPDCIFIGGSDGELHALLHYAWQRLPCQGKLVVSAVTQDSTSLLESFYMSMFASSSQQHDFAKITLEVSKNLPGSTESRRLAPVTLVRCVKP